jgi:hypothetical protein
MIHGTNQPNDSLQGQDQADVIVEISYEVDPARYRLWKDLWSRLLRPMKEMRETQEEVVGQSYRPQPAAEGGRVSRRRGRGATDNEGRINDSSVD